MIGRGRTSGERPWELRTDRHEPDYGRHKDEGKVKGTKSHDFWFGEEPCEEPLVVFHHIQKTAGTAIRHLLHANYKSDAAKVVSVPRHTTRSWFVGLKDGLGDRFLWLRAVAGHDANYLLPLLDGRPAAAFTVVREPVDRVLSRYYFLSRTPSWTLEDLYLGRWDKQIPGFFSGQAKSLLEPLCDTSGIPKTADEPGADEWRERLEQALAAYVVVGTQDRLDETIDALGALPGIRRRELYQVRVQRGRPATSSLEPRVAELIRRNNWLDDELYRMANERLDARAR